MIIFTLLKSEFSERIRNQMLIIKLYVMMVPPIFAGKFDDDAVVEGDAATSIEEDKKK